jgi:hypothetical protein
MHGKTQETSFSIKDFVLERNKKGKEEGRKEEGEGGREREKGRKEGRKKEKEIHLPMKE